MENLHVVGKSTVRKDALDKALGKTKFSGDIHIPGMLYAKVLRSTIAHGILKEIDISAAQALKGVHGVLTAKDIPGSNSHGIIIKDEPVLVLDKIRKIGDALAVVAAETEDIAEEAIRLIKAEIEELPALFDPEEAMKPESPKIYPEGNILSHKKIRKGDTEKAFAQAEIIVQNVYRTQMTEHAYIEPESGLAYMEGEKVVVLASTQNPHFDQKEVARNLSLPLDLVRIIQAPTGGGFGGKLDISVQVYVALLALRTRHPVRLTYTREESVIATTKRHPMIIDYKSAADKNGKLLAVDVTIIGDTGAYASYGPGTLTRTAVHATGPYEVPNVKVDAYTVYTNNPTAGAMRGFGVPQAAFAHEQQMDMLAEKAGLNPIQIRILNALKPGLATNTGQILDNGVGLIDTINAVYARAQNDLGQTF